MNNVRSTLMISLAVLLGACKAQAQYVPVDLGTLGGPSSSANAINEAGDIAGSSLTASLSLHACIFSDGEVMDIGTLGGNHGEAFDINNRGVVVGKSTTSGGAMHAFLWKHGVMTDLGTLGGTTSEARGINDRGNIAGVSINASGNPVACAWINGEIVDLGTTGGKSAANDINNRGQIVGYYSVPGGSVAFICEDGVLTSLGSLGGNVSEARSINDRGQVVGLSKALDGKLHAFLWERGVMTDLGLVGADEAQAEAVSNSGQVVGFTPFALTAHLFADSSSTLLPTLGGAVGVASGVNARGDIVGSTMTAGGDNRATLWRRAS